MNHSKFSFIFKGSSIIDKIFSDEDKYKALAELAGPLILHDEYLLAQRLGNIKVALAFWIRRIQTSLTNDDQEALYTCLLSKQQDLLIRNQDSILYNDNLNINLPPDCTHNLASDKAATTCTSDCSIDTQSCTTSLAKPPQSRENSNYAIPTNNKKRKTKTKVSHFSATSDVNKVQQLHKDIVQNDFCRENQIETETESIKNFEHIDNNTPMEDVLLLPALDSNPQQSEILVDFSPDRNDNTSLPIQPSTTMNTSHESDTIWRELLLLNQDVIINDADDYSDKNITNNNVKGTVMD
ncbi:hypothetical protein GLOIN_2v1820861 [Rhizophagus irregularis DAOM 181602=DAOM 197198]|uniref:Uncharacterized protein n=1 Tax=Rhizophagus irregularis (strain DAOM 181602 / DAOM 197198 / MUCL 43194) TaxID=747089 RepID=A0A2P4NZU4_RHIID|nr:hypothetical protein GLOIN_2v1820861 [Rhizophagus irregularis DAOM 181602=DAOM 197198]POG58666.1 hypothetical protein GLOIN_2v1820861 [Rhizophagus irregularis DAOM 181602=DAOM 197198]|eukprot:XP_025165532.1 hypothetical protein GLOIN_2v1820861 [Rhizophagus irregularis DAOM 181602=DAOM 197198]